MNGSRLTDFSIDHILSSGFPRSAGSSAQKTPGTTFPPGEAFFRRVPGGVCSARPGGPGLRSYGGFRPDLVPPDLSYYPPDLSFYPAGLTFYPRHQTSHPGPMFLTGPAAGRPVTRSRTVFTPGQTQLLQRLFLLTDYPAADARASLAADSGLTEETVRVWFKNRRARRKREKSRTEAQPSSRGARSPLDPRVPLDPPRSVAL
ncbi:unnamed protein product [Arctogadus glacialis]